MKVTPTLETASTPQQRIEAVSALICRQEQLKGELEATKRWIDKLRLRQSEIEAELTQIERTTI